MKTRMIERSIARVFQRGAATLTALVVMVFAARAAEQASVYRTPSPALAAVVDAPLPPVVALSPDRAWLLLLDRP